MIFKLNIFLNKKRYNIDKHSKTIKYFILDKNQYSILFTLFILLNSCNEPIDINKKLILTKELKGKKKLYKKQISINQTIFS